VLGVVYLETAEVSEPKAIGFWLREVVWGRHMLAQTGLVAPMRGASLDKAGASEWSAKSFGERGDILPHLRWAEGAVHGPIPFRAASFSITGALFPYRATTERMLAIVL
jgi:hypothetical protein